MLARRARFSMAVVMGTSENLICGMPTATAGALVSVSSAEAVVAEELVPVISDLVPALFSMLVVSAVSVELVVVFATVSDVDVVSAASSVAPAAGVVPSVADGSPEAACGIASLVVASA